MEDELSPVVHIQFCYSVENIKPVIFTLELPQDTSVSQVLQHLDSSQLTIVEEQLKKHGAWAVFGKKKNVDYLLQDGDRLELCRALIADPMSARRHRAKREHKSGKM
jgi:putative ubiquitin-RnfH superfamily antitoxin RatB of RatAB toxin-antitoxin module